MLLAVENNTAWAASITASFTLSATDRVRFNYLNRLDERHVLCRDIETDKYSIFRVFFFVTGISFCNRYLIL